MAKMTPKMFLHRANSSKVNAQVFLNDQREFLTSGELSELASPILNKLDNKEVMPTPALEQIKAVVFGFMMEKLARTTEQYLERGQKQEQSKDFIAEVYDPNGMLLIDVNGKEMIKSFDLVQRARDYAINRLAKDSPIDSYAEITHAKMNSKSGSPLKFIITRDQAIAIMLRGKKTAIIAKKPVSSSLGWKMKVKDKLQHFSHG